MSNNPIKLIELIEKKMVENLIVIIIIIFVSKKIILNSKFKI